VHDCVAQLREPNGKERGADGRDSLEFTQGLECTPELQLLGNSPKRSMRIPPVSTTEGFPELSVAEPTCKDPHSASRFPSDCAVRSGRGLVSLPFRFRQLGIEGREGL